MARPAEIRWRASEERQGGSPYVLCQFNEAIQLARGRPSKDLLPSGMADPLTKWWTNGRKKPEDAANDVDVFANQFQKSIDRLYAA